MFAIGGRSQPLKNITVLNEIPDNRTGGSQLLVPGKVIASTHIPQGAQSVAIRPDYLCGKNEVMQILVGLDPFGTLEIQESSRKVWNGNLHWVRAIRIADDCHSFNVILAKDHHRLVLQVVRPINPGQELLLWFSEEILATLHMGFLTPANIQGEKNYVCTNCSALYESPNPLKLHLTLGCGKESIALFWEKLSKALIEPVVTQEFHFKLISDPCQTPKQKIAIDLSSTSDKRLKSDEIEIKHSAFKPFRKTLIPPSSLCKLSNNNNSMLYSSYGTWPRLALPNEYGNSPFLASQMRLPRVAENDAHIESLVSSLGKYKEGHICLYCGKSYSRKYGLKIHIRTHTGYKPLKCKYCLRPFGDPSNLNKHVRLHAEGETPYKCDICGKILVRRRDLERHLKSRHSIDSNNSPLINDDESTNSLDDSLSDEMSKVSCVSEVVSANTTL